VTYFSGRTEGWATGGPSVRLCHHTCLLPSLPATALMPYPCASLTANLSGPRAAIGDIPNWDWA